MLQIPLKDYKYNNNDKMSSHMLPLLRTCLLHILSLPLSIWGNYKEFKKLTTKPPVHPYEISD